MVDVDIPIVTVTPPLSVTSSPEFSPPMHAEKALPVTEVPHIIEVTSTRDSVVISVNVYSGRAEVTRMFKIRAKEGQNQVCIAGLPSVIVQESFRVEGRCSATINDVSLSVMPRSYPPDTSQTLEELMLSKKRVEKALERANYTVNVLDTYLASANTQHSDVNTLEAILRTYESTSENLDSKIEALESRKETLEKKIEGEHNRLLAEHAERADDKLNMQASIGVSSEFEGDIKIVIIYAVTNVEWKPLYDIRVDMQSDEEPIVQLGYKATITQNTGENWDNVPLSLETAKPSFGIKKPTISPWSIYSHKLIHKSSSRDLLRTTGRRTALDFSADVDRKSFAERTPLHEASRSSSHGNLNAAFSIPGLSSISGNGASHVATIANLCLGARMSWLCIPKNDARTYLKAVVFNDSECTLLKGSASVYVDGSFIFKTDIPTVLPDDSFECPLGIDPSIRVNYHPCSKKTSQSGFYTKTTCHVFKQPISVFNSKRHPIENLRIVDQFPVSQDPSITVKHIHPPLATPSLHAIESGNTNPTLSVSSIATIGAKSLAPVQISKDADVLAQWWHADEIEQGYPVDMVGADGYVEWICSVAAGSHLGVVLQYEITAPVKAEVVGL